MAPETIPDVLETPEAMLGTFSINSIIATVLFDSGASHTFISQAFIRNHSIPVVAMKNQMLVNSSGGYPCKFLLPLHKSLSKGGRFPSQSYCVEILWH